jgi:hypothetical protein
VGAGVGPGVGSGVGVGVGVGVAAGASTVTATESAARRPLVAPVMPAPTWKLPASCEDGTWTVSVVDPCALEAMVNALEASDCDHPEGTDAPTPNVSTVQVAEFVLPAVSVSCSVAPGSTVTPAGDTLRVGVPAVQGGGAGFVTLTFAATSDDRPLAALFAEARTVYVPGAVDVGTAILNVTRASCPGLSESVLLPRASDHPEGTFAPKLKDSAAQAAELRFLTETDSCIAPPGSSVTLAGDIVTDGADGVQTSAAGLVTSMLALAVAFRLPVEFLALIATGYVPSA